MEPISERCENLSELFVLVMISLVIAVSSAEDERTFSTLKFIKNEARNRLKGDHLNACVRLFSQDFYTVESFPYTKALEAWRKQGRYTA